MSGHRQRLWACGTCGSLYLTGEIQECTGCRYGIVRLTDYEVSTTQTPADLLDEGDELAREAGEMLDQLERKVPSES